MNEIGKFLILLGVISIAVGLFLMLLSKFSFVGKIPGDIVIERRNFTFYFPLGTSIILSILLTLIFYLLSRK